MEILKNYDLTGLNTFHVRVSADLFTELKNESEIKDLFLSEAFTKNEKFFLGGGSNILFTKDFKGLVILNKLKGIEILKEDNENVWLKSMSGETWNDLVRFAVVRGLWGIENLALVPGTVGGAPMQNIGAYGAELKDTLENVEAYEVETGEEKIFTKEECEFGYRDSIFKNALKGKYFISSVALKLSKIPKPEISYKILADHLAEHHIEIKNSKDISDAVSAIRKSKLPDPNVLGNAGSFFKNVYVSEKIFEKLSKEYSDLKFFKEEDGIKIPAGWLIEKCGWKGKRIGNVGVHEKQALILVNYGGATGEEVISFAQQIINAVYQKFGVTLTPEVNLI